jgi:hypothetical protein
MHAYSFLPQHEGLEYTERGSGRRTPHRWVLMSVCVRVFDISCSGGWCVVCGFMVGVYKNPADGCVPQRVYPNPFVCRGD